MDDQYPPTSNPIGTFYPSGYPPMMPTQLDQSRSRSFQNMDSFADPEHHSQPAQSSSSAAYQRSRRRREPQGSDHVKHRRTRSGCYTCRQRRVKCDEARPNCDRCRKGNRECVYPGDVLSATSSSEAGRGKEKESPAGSSPQDSEMNAEEHDDLSPIVDDDESGYGEPESSLVPSPGRRASNASATIRSDSTSSLLESTSTSRRTTSRPNPSRQVSTQSPRPSLTQTRSWSTLPNDVKFYIKFYKENLFHHHYAFKYDESDFLKTTFLQIAVTDQNASLLYAIVAFAAYHHSLTRHDDKIQTFLSYYNQSIHHLRQALSRGQRTVATLLTMLQLATIEEFLGDWVNLLGHQKAALQLMKSLFTPQTIMRDETSRKIIAWYIRFDLFAGIMSGRGTTLENEWFTVSMQYYQQQVRERPDDLGARFEEYFSTARLLAADVALVFARRANNSINDEQFASEASRLTVEFGAFIHTIETAFTDPSCFVKSFANAPPPSADDIVEFRDPNFLYAGKLSTMNFILIDFWAIDLMFKCKLALAQRQQPQVTESALKICKMFEAIQYCDEGQPGGILGGQASLAIAALFLPKEARYMQWCRRKFALIEQSGFIYPPAFRARISQEWGIDVSESWLQDGEGYLDIVRNVRDFIAYRATVPPDAWHTGVRDISGIFYSMHLDETSSPEEYRSNYTDSERNASP